MSIRVIIHVRRVNAAGASGALQRVTEVSLKVCLGGLHRRLHERLQVKPSQMFVLGPASRVKPVLKPSAAYTGKVKP